MYVDPDIVRTKVDRELSEYLQLAEHFRARGIWLLEYQFPKLLFAFVAKATKPPLAMFGIVMDFSNYDVEPPSIRFVDPLTKRALNRSELPPFLRQEADGQVRQLVTAWTPDDDRPFMCLQGVREYHDNPGHSGDSWFLHRASGAGKMIRLLDFLGRYGSEPVVGQQFAIQMVPNGQFLFNQPFPPP